jgi:hypothetical protein
MENGPCAPCGPWSGRNEWSRPRREVDWKVVDAKKPVVRRDRFSKLCKFAYFSRPSAFGRLSAPSKRLEPEFVVLNALGLWFGVRRARQGLANGLDADLMNPRSRT